MIKKITAFTIVLFTIGIFLVHAVIPHHHHLEEVCMSDCCCDPHDTETGHHFPIHNHRHEDKKESVSCFINQAVILPSQNKQEVQTTTLVKKIFPDFHFADVHFKPESYFSTFNCNVLLSGTAKINPFKYTSTGGLRAPPIL